MSVAEGKRVGDIVSFGVTEGVPGPGVWVGCGVNVGTGVVDANGVAVGIGVGERYPVIVGVGVRVGRGVIRGFVGLCVIVGTGVHIGHQ